jgi:hypothetical protein
MEQLRQDGYPEGFVKAEAESAPSYVRSFPRLSSNVAALTKLTDPVLPTQRLIRSKAFLQVGYGFGDASGKGFGSII